MMKTLPKFFLQALMTGLGSGLGLVLATAIAPAMAQVQRQADAPTYASAAVQVFEPASLQEIRARHAGKPFVLVLWSLDCSYCQASLQALAQVQRRRAIDIVTVATDRGDEANRPLIGRKLAASGVRSEIWAFGAAPAEQLRYAIDPRWRGEVPRSYWFDREGRAVSHSGTVSVETATRLLP